MRSMTRLAVMIVLALAALIGHAEDRRALAGTDDPAIAEVGQQIVEHAGIHRLIVLGEKHGTREIPALVARLLGHYSQQHPVTLALEVPDTEQPALERYLASQGRPQDWTTLATTAFWQVADDQHDGRRTVQMRQLIETVRGLRDKGRAVDVLAYDVSEAESEAHDHHWRDEQMARRLREAHTRQPATVMLVVTGNVHAMRVRPEWAPPELQLAPMTSRLLDLQPYAVNITAAGGHFWGCQQPGSCEAWAERSWKGTAPVTDVEPGRVYDLEVQLPRFTVADLVEPACEQPGS